MPDTQPHFQAPPPPPPIAPPGAADDPQDGRPAPSLSPTEQRVCALLLERLTEQQIAEQLDRSPNTVHVHVRNIYRKLAVRTRRQLFEYPDIRKLASPEV